jgi:hypothetical protein
MNIPCFRLRFVLLIFTTTSLSLLLLQCDETAGRSLGTGDEIRSHDQRHRWNGSSAVQEKAQENLLLDMWMDSNIITRLHRQHLKIEGYKLKPHELC